MADLSQHELDRVIHEAIEEEMHTALEQEIETLNQAVHTVFEQEIVIAKETVQEAVETAVETALAENPGFNLTANVNTLMALSGVIAYWRGVWGLLDWLLEDSLEGYVACLVFGLGVGWVIRYFKLPVAEGVSLL